MHSYVLGRQISNPCVLVQVVRLYVGTLFTSLDMQGASISLLPVNQQRLTWLDAPTQVSATLYCLTAYRWLTVLLSAMFAINISTSPALLALLATLLYVQGPYMPAMGLSYW